MHESKRSFQYGVLDLDVHVKRQDNGYLTITLSAWPVDGSGLKVVSAHCRRYAFRAMRQRLTGKASLCSKPNGCPCWAGF